VEACADRMIHLRFSLGFRPCRFLAVEVVGRGINRGYFSGIFLRSVSVGSRTLLIALIFMELLLSINSSSEIGCSQVEGIQGFKTAQMFV
jgi:hypothetical protein